MDASNVTAAVNTATRENYNNNVDAAAGIPSSNSYERLAPNTQVPSSSGPETEQQMMQSIVEIFQLDEDPVTENEGWDERVKTPEELEEKRRRTERLRGIFPLLQRLWSSRSELMPIVAEKLADGSRSIKWRGPIGDAGILDFFLDLLDTYGIQHNLMVHILRLIGNSCADTDENRERVVSKNCIHLIIRQLQNGLLLPFAIPVLFNVLFDYIPAQQQASESHLSKGLVDLISSPRFFESRSFISYVCKIFDLLITQPSEIDIAPENIPIILLKMAIDQRFQPDLEDFMAMTNSATAYLKHQRFQESLMNHPSGLSTTLTLLTDSYRRFGPPGSYSNLGSIPIDMEDSLQLSQMRSELISVLSDISALPSFSDIYPLTSPLITSIIRMITAAPSMHTAQSSPQLVVAACIILGNIARTDIACQTLVHTYSIHLPLTTILSTTSRSIDNSTPTSSQQTQLTYSVLGLLRNLGIAASNKACLGEAGILEPGVLPRLWSLDTSPQLQYTAIALTRQSIIGCLPNVRRLCRPLSSDPDSPASSKSSLHLLLDLQSRSDAEATKMEIARLVAAVCRVFHSPQSNEGQSATEAEELTSLRQKFYEMHSGVTAIDRPLNYLIIQNQHPEFSPTTNRSFNQPSRYPVLRSEGWFILALMAGTKEGSEVVAQCMHNPNVFGLVCEILSGKKWDAGALQSAERFENTEAGNTSNAQEDDMMSMIAAESPQAGPTEGSGTDEGQQARDRSNVLVLVSQLLRNQRDEMGVFWKDILLDLVKAAGKGITEGV